MGFIRLPRELRDKVYVYAMNDITKDFVITPSKLGGNISLSALPDFFFADAAILYESLLVFLQDRNFVLWNGAAKRFCDFLNHFGGAAGYTKVRSLRIGSLSDLSTLRSFTGLKHLEIDLQWYGLRPTWGRDLAPYTETELRSTYDFAAVAGLPNLQTLGVVPRSYEWDLATLGARQWSVVSGTLHTLFREQLQVHQKSVNITVLPRSRG